ncbi:AAA family ATPase [Schaedlerella sp.]|uniref:AAA family ATPase n=1 Tax=Schaedlerella sp. TaxID=2676057 RepID=UPI0037479166
MGAVAENLRVDESSEWFEDYDDVLDEEEYPDELPADDEGPENEAYPEDIEISFGGEDEEEAEGYEEEAEYGEISDGAGERFTIEYQEDGEFEYEDEYPNEEPEYEEPELEEIEPAYDEAGQEYEVSEPGYAEEETGYEASEPEYESIEPGYEETEPEYGEVETEYEAAGPEYEEAEAEYEGIETGYEEAEPEYAEEETGYETFEPEYEEAEAGYEGIEAEYDGAEPEYGEIESGYEDEPEYEELEPGYEAAEPEYEDAGEEYEDGGYETGEPEYAEIYEDEEPEYEEEYEEYDPEYTAEYEDEEAVYEGEYEDGQYDEEAEYEGGQYDEEAEYEDDYELDYDEGYAEEDDYEGNYEEEEYYEEDAYYEEEDAEYDAASAEVDLEHEFRPQRSSGRRYDEREVPDEEEEIDILSKSTPLSRKETAKLIATGKTSPLPMDEISDALSLSDTGFVVHGRYDLKTQSGIGTRAGLTEEQKKLFSYFVPVRGMSEQLVDVLEQDKNCTNRRGTSNTGNLLIIGNKGNGKTVLAVDVVKAIQKQRNIRQGRVAIVTGDSLNKKKISDIFSKLYGGALIIEKAGKMNEKTVARVNKAMERDTGELLIVLEDQRKPLDRLLTSNREFRRKFTSRLEVPILINDELVTFGQTYAQENGYQIDEMGILALYSRIDMLQREDHAVTIAEVKEVMDEAMEHSQKASAKKLVKRVLGKNRDDSDRIILTEKDFN